MLAHPLDPALSRFMIMRARIALDNLDQVGALGFGQRVLLRSRQEAQRVCRSPKGLRVVAIQRGVATESWSVPVGGERCNQTKCLPVALVRIIAFSNNTHTWHAFDLVDKWIQTTRTIVVSSESNNRRLLRIELQPKGTCCRYATNIRGLRRAAGEAADARAINVVVSRGRLHGAHGQRRGAEPAGHLRRPGCELDAGDAREHLQPGPGIEHDSV